jgi:quercetin dioxygenase-like cupin family protein
MAGEQAQKHTEGVVKRSESVGLKDVTAGTATQMQVLIGPEDGAPHFAMRRFVMGKGGGVPTHTNKVEHEQYVLRGRAQVGIGSKVHDVRSGDILYIPAGTPHYYRVIEAPFEFLCLVPNAPDQLEILKDDRPGGADTAR